MKKQKMRNRQLIYNNIRSSYKEGKELLKKNPKSMDRLYNVILVFAILLLVLSVLSIFIQNIVILTLLLWVFVAFIILALVNSKMEKKWKVLLEEKADEIKEICKMGIEDEAKKYDVKSEELALYMCCKYKKPKVIKGISTFVSIIFTGLAVQYLPGFDQVEHGVLTFIVLVSANMAISFCASYINEKIGELDNFDFYILNPYSKIFEKIDEKLKQDD